MVLCHTAVMPKLFGLQTLREACHKGMWAAASWLLYRASFAMQDLTSASLQARIAKQVQQTGEEWTRLTVQAGHMYNMWWQRSGDRGRDRGEGMGRGRGRTSLRARILEITLKSRKPWSMIRCSSSSVAALLGAQTKIRGLRARLGKVRLRPSDKLSLQVVLQKRNSLSLLKAVGVLSK